MFTNPQMQKEIQREQKFARQFVIAIVMILLVAFNVGLYMFVRMSDCGEMLPLSYKIQTAFIPLMLGLMAFYFFRLHRKNVKQIREKFSGEETTN
jgi:hypothetical protein